MVMKTVELVMAKREGLRVGKVIERNLRKHKSEREASRLRECNKCKIFYRYFKYKIFYTNLS